MTTETPRQRETTKKASGLSGAKWARMLTIAGIAIAIMNMIAVWVLMLQESSGAWGLPNGSAPAMEAAVQLAERILTYEEARLALGFAFALLAIGFSFFVMGIESAISFKGEQKDLGSVALKTTSPGVICIILATVLVSFILLRGTSAFPYASGPTVLAAPNSAPPELRPNNSVEATR